MRSGGIIYVTSLFPLPTRTIMPFWLTNSRSSSDSLSKSSYLTHLSWLRNCSIFVLAGSPPLRPLIRDTLEHNKFLSSTKSALFSKGFPTFSLIEATVSQYFLRRVFWREDDFHAAICSSDTSHQWIQHFGGNLVLLWSPIYCFFLSLPQTQTGSALVRCLHCAAEVNTSHFFPYFRSIPSFFFSFFVTLSMASRSSSQLSFLNISWASETIPLPVLLMQSWNCIKSSDKPLISAITDFRT